MIGCSLILDVGNKTHFLSREIFKNENLAILMFVFNKVIIYLLIILGQKPDIPMMKRNLHKKYLKRVKFLACLCRIILYYCFLGVFNVFNASFFEIYKN